jgi:hypothetical protein
MDLKLAKQRYTEQKKRARARSVEFILTFEEWVDIWQQSGKWDLRGRGNGKYVMSRYGDIGPYAVGNVKIVIHRDNVAEMLYRRNADPANRKKISDALIGRPKSATHRANLSKANTGKIKGPLTEEHKQNIRKPKKDKTNYFGKKDITYCPHCGKEGGVNVMKRWHFDKCKANSNTK